MSCFDVAFDYIIQDDKPKARPNPALWQQKNERARHINFTERRFKKQ
jgi:hypothetical protein